MPAMLPWRAPHAAACTSRRAQQPPSASALAAPSLQGLNNLAVVYTQQGRAQEALQLLQAAVMAAPDYAEAHNNLGVLQVGACVCMAGFGWVAHKQAVRDIIAWRDWHGMAWHGMAWHQMLMRAGHGMTWHVLMHGRHGHGHGHGIAWA